MSHTVHLSLMMKIEIETGATFHVAKANLSSVEIFSTAIYHIFSITHVERTYVCASLGSTNSILEYQMWMGTKGCQGCSHCGYIDTLTQNRGHRRPSKFQIMYWDRKKGSDSSHDAVWLAVGQTLQCPGNLACGQTLFTRPICLSSSLRLGLSTYIISRARDLESTTYCILMCRGRS